MTETVTIQRKARGERPRYFEDPAIDKVLSITMALAGEVAVLRDRLDSVERLLEKGEPLTQDLINSYAPDGSVREERDAWRESFLSTILRSVHEEREGLAEIAQTQASEQSTAYDDAVHLVEAD
ncbi:hypothetical protein [Parasphingorhabdus sp.]|mgnify:CR=1 FL=1|uniref:hypothetical protein n=1 Tax=Parasphingorhabdus sp. TaxID=2709688 RepID=UPI003A944B80